MVNNTLGFDRNEVVEAEVTISDAGSKKYVRVYSADGTEIPSQVISYEKNGDESTYKILFQAEVTSLGSRVYQVAPAAKASELTTDLQAVEKSNGSYILNNNKYKVTINKNGDISSIYDTTLSQELLESPIRLSLHTMTDKYWAAWELNTGDYWNKLGDDYVSGNSIDVEVTEEGTCRTSVQVTRKYGNSTYTQTVSLSAGGQFVTIDNLVDWQEKGKLLKAEFNTKSSNSKATYDLGLGAVQRGNNTESLAEVPVQQWADISNSDGSFGVTVLNDGKTGMDKYDDNTFRLSLIYTPSNDYSHDTDSSSGNSNEFYSSGQYCQDQGENRFSYGVYGHGGSVGDSDAAKIGQAFGTQMTVTQTVEHEGVLGDTFTAGSLTGNNVVLRALKKSETNDDIVIVRVNEMSGKSESGVTFTMGNGIKSATEVYTSEEYKANATVENGKLVFDLDGYEVKTFAIKLKDADEGTVVKVKEKNLPLSYNLDAYSSNDNKTDGGITTLGDCYPSELVPSKINFAGVTYTMGNSADGRKNAVRCNGQTITLNDGYDTLHILAASTGGDKEATFKVDGKEVTLNIGDYAENVGAGTLYDLGMTAYIKEQIPAFEATHRHTNGKDNVTASTYMFAYKLDIAGAKKITLPDDSDIILFAATQQADAEVDANLATQVMDSIPREDSVINRFETGFEEGDMAVLENTINLNNDNTGVENNSCSITTERASTGSRSLKITGNDTNSDKSCVYYTLSDKQIRIKNGTILQFDLYADNNISRYCSIDLDINYNEDKCGNGNLMTGSSIRDDSRVVDTTGVQVHPARGHGTAGRWVTITVDLAEIFGGDNITVTKIMLAYDHSEDTGNFTAYIDNLFIGVPDNALEIALDKAKSINRNNYANVSISNLDSAVAVVKKVMSEDSSSLIVQQAVDTFYAAYDALVPYRSAFANVDAWDYQHKSFNSILIDKVDDTPTNIGGVKSGGWAKYSELDFGSQGAKTFQIEYSGWKTGTDGVIEIHQGSKNGTLLGTVNIPETANGSSADWSNYTTVTCELNRVVTGEQDIYLVFKNGSGGDTCNVKSFTFKQAGSKDALTQLYDEASKKNLSDYSETSAAKVEVALAKSATVLSDNSVSQATINAAFDTLQAAMAGLTKTSLSMGDMNQDGELTVADAVLLRGCILTGGYDAVGDLDSDKTLSINDLLLLKTLVLDW